jgi:hypothetical protein
MLLGATLLGAFALLVQGTYWLSRRWMRRIVVRKVTDPADPDLDSALDLYEDRLDENVRDSREDIRRWIGEGSYGRGTGPGTLTILVYLAACRGRPHAFFYGEHYHAQRLLLVSYIVARGTREGEQGVRRIAKVLAKAMRRGGCRGIVFELAQTPGPSKDASQARWRDFQRLVRPFGVQLARLEIPYVQPCLSLWDPSLKEEPQHLMYGSFQQPHPTTGLPKATVVSVLHTVYNGWYAGSFEDDMKQNLEYRAYVRALFDRLVAELPDPVPVSWLRRSRGPTGAH